jgi:hypothetical protein
MLLVTKDAVTGREFAKISPEEAAAQILTKMKETAENYLGEKVTEALRTGEAMVDMGEAFEMERFLEENEIDQVLYLGYYTFYAKPEFLVPLD